MSDIDSALGFGGPIVYPYTLDTTSTRVLGVSVDGGRSALIFHNPNATAQVAVCPITNVFTDEELDAVVNGAGSYTIIPGAELRLTGLGTVNCAWNAVSDTPGAAFTIFEFNR